MVALFVHDHQFIIRGDQVYSDKLSYSVWRRYLPHFSEVVVIARAADGEGQKSLPKSSGSCVSFIFVSSISNLRALLNGGGEAASVIETTLRSADILIARLPSELGLLACRIARKLNKPYIVEVVGCAGALWNYGSIRARFYMPLSFIRMRLAVSKAPYASYVSQNFLQKRYPATSAKRTIAVSNVDLPDIGEEVINKRISRIKNRPHRVVIGLIGSLKARYKGVDVAIDALSKLRYADIDAELRILGGGDTGFYLRLAKKKSVSDCVYFDGLLSSQSEVMKWLDSIDIYIQPSLQEGVPRALIEAMSRGCPAIGSNRGGIPELLAPDCLIPAGDAQKLSDKLRFAISSKEWCLSQAAQNVERAREFSKEILDAKRYSFLECIARDIRAGD